MEDTARATIDELHGLLVTLREHGGSRGSARAAVDPGPSAQGVDGLPALMQASQAAGVPTIYAVLGDPQPLPELLGFTLYRVSQEALTNVRKHAGPRARVDARLRYTNAHVELEISNSGSVPVRRSTRGLGLIGMHERVASCGGVLEAGPRSRGGYLVRAVLPIPSPESA